MNELMKFHELFMCGEYWCDTFGSTQTLGAAGSPEGDTGHQPALHTLSRQSCRSHPGRATAQGTSGQHCCLQSLQVWACAAI